MTPRFKPMEYIYFPGRRLLVLKIDYGTTDITGNVLCYYTWDFTAEKTRVFSVAATDAKASSCPNVATCTQVVGGAK